MRRPAAIDRKLQRDLWALKSQVVSIALVIGCGIGGFVATFSTHESLGRSRDFYYDSARFAHLFASVKRAPLAEVQRLRLLPGVADIEARIVHDTQLDVPGVVPPMVARLVGADFTRRPAMNRLALKAGRWPVPGSATEAVANLRFLEARSLAPGAEVTVLVNGKRERLQITGGVLSPEYIYATRGGGMPDDEWFAVLWVDADRLAAAYDMEGAFNSVSLRLQGDASPAPVIAGIDRVLGDYGSLGAIAREDQPSHRILEQEIAQQRVIGSVLPAIFLAVAAFILNVVLRRQVETQRGEIAALKALGYDNRTIGAHYLKFASVIVVLGAAAGAALGGWLGSAMTGLYTDFFQFPQVRFRVVPWTLAAGTAIAALAAFGGALAAIAGILRLRAAEALRPPAPDAFRPLLVERLGLSAMLTPAQRMILRNLERRPVRAALAVAGIGASVAILLSGTFWSDSVDHFIDVQFNRVQPAGVSIAFVEPRPRGVIAELARLPGVQQAEATRVIPARLRAGARSYRTTVTGVTDEGRLLRIVDAGLRESKPAPGGMILTTRLAERLGVAAGDMVGVELLEGRRVNADFRVSATVRELAGMNAWMRLEELNRLAREGPVVSAAGLLASREQEPALLQRLKQMPAVAVVTVTSSLLETFRRNSARNLLFFTAILTAFATTIAVGVVYNNARIQLAERAWELATLRVLGMTRAEVSVLLLGELAFEILTAVPLGLLAGYWLSALIVALTHGDVFEIPLVIRPDTYLFAAAAVAGAGAASALIVRRRIDRLDLVGVLKTRE
ncbi:MAG TPA: ABC transporter permease [Ramlibacter sp.]|uniref:ABC transporter permease n=1 Tax=Ramlibacter sp. TaxID=1917967 RepID=UPI002ED59FC9